MISSLLGFSPGLVASILLMAISCALLVVLETWDAFSTKIVAIIIFFVTFFSISLGMVGIIKLLELMIRYV